MKATLNREALDAHLFKENMTLNGLAEKMDVHRSYLWLFRAKKRSPGPVVRKKLQDATGLSFDELFVVDS